MALPRAVSSELLWALGSSKISLTLISQGPISSRSFITAHALYCVVRQTGTDINLHHPSQWNPSWKTHSMNTLKNTVQPNLGCFQSKGWVNIGQNTCWVVYLTQQTGLINFYYTIVGLLAFFYLKKIYFLLHTWMFITD